MVLPTLQSYSATKQLTTAPDIMQRNQETETEKKFERTQIGNNSRAQSGHNSAHSKWSSPISGILSDEALRIEQDKKEKSNRLEKRRIQLSALLETEKNKFQDELLTNRRISRESIPETKTRANSLRSDRQALPDEKLNETQRTNTVDLDSLEPQNTTNIQPEYWSEQLDERRLVHQEESRQHLDEYDRQEQEGQTDRKKRIIQLKVILQQQMDQIKQNEEQSEILKQEEEHLLKEQTELNIYEEERQQMEKRCVQQDHGRQLLRQHKLKLHKRAKEIQEQLELDIKILASLAHIAQQNHLEQLRRDALDMLNEFQQQITLEKQKEQDFDAMFQEEAAKEWSRREKEWNHERESREKSMHKILNDRQNQIMQRLETLKEQQQETYEKQCALVADMEQARKFNLIAKQKQNSIVQQEQAQSRLELERQIGQSEQKQKQVITPTPVESKFHGRRRVNWN